MISKDTARSNALEFRRNMTAEEKRNIDSSVTEFCLGFIRENGFLNVLIYSSKPLEIATQIIIRELISHGIKVYLPKCFACNSMRFFRLESIEGLVCGKYGIYEPESCSEEYSFSPDTVCIVPALSVAKNGMRIGWGGGYYDRFLAVNNVKSAALCCDENLIDNCIFESTDYAVDYIITQSGVVPTDARREVSRNE